MHARGRARLHRQLESRIETAMRIHATFLIFIVMSTLAIAQTLPIPPAITDPKQVTSKPDAEVEQGEQSLSLKRWYMPRAVGNTACSPDGKTIAFVTNITGRTKIGMGAARGGGPMHL